jgi:hypothetical protein
MGFEGGGKAFGKGSGAVIFAFAVADDDLAIGKVDVFDAEAHTFHEAEARAEEKLSHQFGDAVHFGDDGEGFISRENGGEFDFLEENVAVEKEDGTEGFTSTGSVQGFWVEAATLASVARWVM